MDSIESLALEQHHEYFLVNIDVAHTASEIKIALDDFFKKNNELGLIVIDKNLTLEKVELYNLYQIQYPQRFLIQQIFNTKKISAWLKQKKTPQKSNERSQKRLATLNLQIIGLQKALVATLSAQTIGEVEAHIFQALKESLALEWCRIFFKQNESIDAQLQRLQNLALYKAPLVIGHTALGQIIFARRLSLPFKKTEIELIRQVADSVSLAIDRITKLTQAETLKQQWERTFDAISEPLCLTDHHFRVIRTNSAFAKELSTSKHSLAGQDSLQAFVDSEIYAEKIRSHLESKGDWPLVIKGLKSKKSERQYDLSAHCIKKENDVIYTLFFRDVSEQNKIEKQLIESAKLAELGTIGSSIAHEINNPLGGLLSFLQLIKMDLKKEDPVWPDILEMESAAYRCKEIVENLLRFSRQNDSLERVEVDLRDILRQALKITELQARSLGVTVEMKWPQNPVKILGHFNLLAQAISHFLQNSFEAVAEMLTENPRYKGLIHIDLSTNKDRVFIDITDNGVGISPENQNKIFNPLFSTKSRRRNQGLGLTIAYNIIDEHQGQIEISSQPKRGTRVKISLTSV